MPEIEKTAEIYNKQQKGKDAQFVPHFATWIQQKRWEIQEQDENFKEINMPTLIDRMKKLGYIIRVLDIDAKDFGVPQVRRRIVFIGIRKDCFKGWKPLLTHKEITFRQATADLKPTKEEILESTPTDKNAKTVQMAFNMMKPGESASKYHPRRLYFGHLKLSWDKPSPTVICHSHQLSHPKEKRYLTLMECKRISSFPDNFKFTSRNDGFTRMGNSVPPVLMKHISKYAVECSTI